MPHKSREERIAYSKKRYQERKEEFKALEKVRYHGDRERIRLRRSELSDRHKAKNAERERNRYASMRLEAIAKYGGSCACCGESNYLFLEFDHVNNDGAAHRRKVGSSARMLLSEIRSQGYPDAYQILCANCNQGKKRNKGICPHKSPPSQ